MKLKVTIKEIENRSLPSISGIGAMAAADRSVLCVELCTSTSTSCSSSGGGAMEQIEAVDSVN